MSRKWGRIAEYALGDILEEYSTGRRSRLWLCRQVLSTILPVVKLNPEGPMFSAFGNDVRYAARALAKNPGFAAVAILALALGIGVNAGIFTVLNGAALKQLPTPGANQLVSVYQELRGKIERNVHGSNSMFSTPEYEDYRDHNHVFTGLAAYEPFLQATRGGDRPEQLWGQLTSCNYFEVLNEPPALGRVFTASDCAAPGASAVVVISDALWRNSFGGDANIVGSKVILNRRLFTVAGVAKPGFTGTEAMAAQFWVPFSMQGALDPAYDFYGGNWSWLALLGRAKPDVSLEQVRADLAVIAARIDADQANRSTRLDVFRATLLGMPEERQATSIVGGLSLAGAGMVLLIACANVANLLLARAAGRQHEIAIRLSVGATRWRLIRQLLTESMLIALVGGGLGCLLAFPAFNAIVRVIEEHLPHGSPVLTFNVAPDWHVLTYALILTFATGIVFGLAPALRASRPDVSGALARRAGGGFLRQTLVGVQVAVCMVLLVAAGLLLHGLWVAQTVDPGFSMKNIATVSFGLEGQGYTTERAAAFQRQLGQRLEAAPGVEVVSESRSTPLGDEHYGTQFTIQGEAQPRNVQINWVSPEYFSVIGLPILRGRNFTKTEAETGAPVAILTESTARHFWPNQDPLGKTLRDGDGKRELEVVGIAKDAQVSKIGYSDTIYLYLAPGPKEQMRMQWMVRYAAGFGPAATAIRDAVASLDPDLLVDVQPLEANLDLWRSISRIVASLAGSLGALALLLASIGIYGVVAFAVSRRVREIGIRMALGADGGDVRNLILRQAMMPVAVGGLIGIAGCVAVSKLLSSMLFGVSSYDPVTFVGVPLMLLGVALFASYIPARRAVRIDPMVALRYE